MESHRQLDWRVRVGGTVAIVAAVVVAIPYANVWSNHRKQAATMRQLHAIATALESRATDV